MPNFNNIYKHTLKWYPHTNMAILTLYELEDEIIEFHPRTNSLFGFIVNDVWYTRFEYYKEFKHYTYRYNTLTYVLHTQDHENGFHLDGYLKFLIDNHIKPNSYNKSVGRFHETREPLRYADAAFCKDRAIADFHKRICA